MMYTYRDFGTSKIKRTRGRFSYWSMATGPLDVRCAVFQNSKGTVNVPCYLLTKETIGRIPPMPKPIPEYPGFKDEHSYFFYTHGGDIAPRICKQGELMNALFQNVHIACSADFDKYKQVLNSPWSEWIKNDSLSVAVVSGGPVTFLLRAAATFNFKTWEWDDE